MWDNTARYGENAYILHKSSPQLFQKWMEKELEEISPTDFFFTIRILGEDKLIGGLGLNVINWAARESFIGIFIGEREYWGKGYGTDAMRVLLRFAFQELGLHRLSLGVFADNLRAIRSYQKAGFVPEGRTRQDVQRDPVFAPQSGVNGGRRGDTLWMGILREEWLGLDPGT